jgi:hypothetical protein
MKTPLSVNQMAIRDIANENKINRKDEKNHYFDHKYLYTIGKLHIARTDSRYESYILPTHMLDTAETRALNRELGLHLVNKV